jgi:hypothetical protein
LVIYTILPVCIAMQKWRGVKIVKKKKGKRDALAAGAFCFE